MSCLVEVSQSYNTEKHPAKKILRRQPDKELGKICLFKNSLGLSVVSCVCLKTLQLRKDSVIEFTPFSSWLRQQKLGFRGSQIQKLDLISTERITSSALVKQFASAD